MAATALRDKPNARKRRPLAIQGGTDGNEQLTAQLGVILLVLFAALGVTIPDLQQLIFEHLFLGLLLLGPVVAKIGSTGYRFFRYYTHDPAYRKKGPPELILRLSAPIVVLSTVVVFVSGVLLMFVGPANRNPLLTIHKLSFIVWVVFMVLHVLGHLLELPRSLRAAEHNRTLTGSSGAGGRWITVGGSIVVGLVLAVVLIPQFAPWTARGAIGHHHDHPGALTSRIRPPVTPG